MELVADGAGADTLSEADLILVPGAWTRAAAFEDVAEALRAEGWSSQVMEHPSRARKLAQIDRGGLAALDRAVDELIDASAGPPVLVGHSLGGLVALRAANRHRVRALVLLMPASPSGMLRSILSDTVRDPVNTLRLLGAAVSVTGASRLGFGPPAGLYSDRATAEDFERGAKHRADEPWANIVALTFGTRQPARPISAPTLVVAGAQDGIVRTDSVEVLANELGAEFVELDVAHAFNEEPSYTLVTDVVVEFLARA